MVSMSLWIYTVTLVISIIQIKNSLSLALGYFYIDFLYLLVAYSSRFMDRILNFLNHITGMW